MPPYYTCRMCDKKMATNVDPNTDIFFVKNKKGWFGHEWECVKCYRSRPIGTMTDRDGFREKGVKEEVLEDDTYKMKGRQVEYADEYNYAKSGSLTLKQIEEARNKPLTTNEEYNKVQRSRTGYAAE